jgi:hypothetical protein
MYKPFTALIAVLGLTLLTACGSGVEGDICAASIQCEGGNDKDVNACIGTANGAEQQAAAYDCSDAYTKLVDCVSKTGICKSTHYNTSCGAESTALFSCEKAASGNK